MKENVQQQEEQQVLVSGTPVDAANTKTVFGALNSPTPLWATWMFRSIFLITSVALFVVSSDPAFSDELKIRLGVYLKAIDLLAFGFSKLFGLVPTDLKP